MVENDKNRIQTISRKKACVIKPANIRVELTLWLIMSSSLGFPSGSVVKNLPAMQEMQVRSLGQEDPLEVYMAAHSSILAWKIPWTEGPGRLQSKGSQRVGHN